jgi:hypothetical protein
MTDEANTVRRGNRPDIRPRDEEVLFHDTGPTGWGRRRDLGDYKGKKSEHNFADQHDKFYAEGDDAA